MPPFYSHLLVIVAIQVALAAALYSRFGARSDRYSALLGLFALGLPFGLVIDLVVGSHWRVFDYPGADGKFAFLTLNGVFSYGAALCTAWLLPCTMTVHRSSTLRVCAVFALAGSIAVLALLDPNAISPLLRTLVASAAIILIAESTAALSGRLGPLLAFGNGQFSPLICLVGSSILVGAVYESANGLFPLWRWHLAHSLPRWATETSIILFGYFVLLLPMFTVARLTFRDPR